MGRTAMLNGIQESGRLKKSITRAGRRLEEMTTDSRTGTIVVIVVDQFGKSTAPFVATALHKAVSENTRTKRELILEHLGKEFHYKGCTFDHACKACVTGGEGGLDDKIIRAHNNIKSNIANQLRDYLLEAIDQRFKQHEEERRAGRESKVHTEDPKDDNQKKKHKAEKREDTPPKATGSKEEKKKKREKSPRRSRERSRGRPRERARGSPTRSVVRFTQKGIDPTGLNDLDREQLMALQGAINDKLQNRRDESEERARAAKRTREESKEEVEKARPEEEEEPDYEGSEDDKPPEKASRPVEKKEGQHSGSEESDEDDEELKRQIRADLKSDSESPRGGGIRLKERARHRSRTPPRSHRERPRTPSWHRDDDWWSDQGNWQRHEDKRQVRYQVDDWYEGDKGKSKGKGKNKSKDKSRSQPRGHWKWQPASPKTVGEISKALEKCCKEIEFGSRVVLTWREIKELGVSTRMCSKPNPRHSKINLSPEVRSYRKWSFILKDDGSDWEEIETNQSAEDETVFEGDEKPRACVVFLIPSEVIGTGATAMYVNMDQTSRAQTQMLVEGHQIDQLQQGAYMERAAAVYKALDKPGLNRQSSWKLGHLLIVLLGQFSMSTAQFASQPAGNPFSQERFHVKTDKQFRALGKTN